VTWEAAVQSLIDDPTQAELAHACYFDPPLETAVKRYHSSDEWLSIRSIIGAARGRALDIGAGNGIVSCALAADGWTTTALEPDPSDLVGRGAIIRASKSLGLAVEVIEGSGESVPVADESFDLIVARQVLHHARDLDAFCLEIARALKPGGMFLSFRDHVVSGPEQLEAFFDYHPLHKHYGGENAFPESRYADAITGAGLTISRKWRQFEAPFNYAPKTREDIAHEVVARLVPKLLSTPTRRLISAPAVFPIVCALLSAMDRRPGRIVSFLARKPAR
jgi:SAM-dependent methyltransferase